MQKSIAWSNEGRGGRMKKLLSFVLAIAMVSSLVPAPALAEALDELDAIVVEEVETSGPNPGSEEPGREDDAAPDAAAAPDAVAPDAAAQDDKANAPDIEAVLPATNADDAPIEVQSSQEDPFYLVDSQTGKRVTTLHTSGTYRLVKPDGTPYTEWLHPTFELLGADPHGGTGYYQVTIKEVQDANYNNQALYLENLTYDAYGKEWQIPTGTYQVRTGGTLSDKTYLSQRYRVINDGSFSAQFDFATDSEPQNNRQFSVKPYDKDKTDYEYDGSYWDADEDGNAVQVDNTPELEPFDLASDVRLKLGIESPMPLNNNAPELQSIALWKADESLAQLTGGKYGDAYDPYVSRVPELLQQGGLTTLPSWPNALNFTDDAKVTTLWERGGTDLTPRVELPEWEIDNGYDVTSASIVVDHANFSKAAVQDGLYFPLVTVKIAGETCTYAYYPIQIKASSTGQRTNPRITTSALANTRVGDVYEARLKGKTGAAQSGSFSWAVTSGSLPAGLALNKTTGAIAGTPTKAGTYTFGVTLTETIDGKALVGTRDLTLRVDEKPDPKTALSQLTLGNIAYTPGTTWLRNSYYDSTYVDLSIPISLDLRDKRYNLSQTELWYLVRLVCWDGDPTYYVWHDVAADLTNDDGTTLEVPVLVDGGGEIFDAKELTGVRAFLVPKTNDGSYAFDLGPIGGNYQASDGTAHVQSPEVTLAFRYGDTSTGNEEYHSDSYRFMKDDGYTVWHLDEGTPRYTSLPDMPYTQVENPDITFGSWLHFPSLDLGGNVEDWPITSARVRLWPYDGATTPAAQQVGTIEHNSADPSYEYGWNQAERACRATFKVAPGTYAVVIEGEVPEYDENGEAIEGRTTWVDVTKGIEGARVLSGTYPKQHLVTVGPNEGFDDGSNLPQALGVTFTSDYLNDVSRHTLRPLFQASDGSTQYVGVLQTPNGYVDYTVNWYRRVGADASSDVLVATGNDVMFGTSKYDLYVEVVPQGRDASFWKSTRVKVSEKSRIVEVKVPYKTLFTGTFTLSCEEGNKPDAGSSWGLLEVQTPVASGGYVSSNLWANAQTVRVPNLTSGSIVTFAPRMDLFADSVSYTVPQDVSADFSQRLVAPKAKGSVTFAGLSFAGTDGRAQGISLTDGLTGVSVKRVQTNDDGSERLWDAPFLVADDGRIVLQSEYEDGTPHFMLSNNPTKYRITVTHRDAASGSINRLGVRAADYAARTTFEVELSKGITSATVDVDTLRSRGYAVLPLDKVNTRISTLLLYDAAGKLVDKGPAGAAQQVRTPFLDAGAYTLYLVDSNCANTDAIATLDGLRNTVLTGAHADHGVGAEFRVQDGAITTIQDDSFAVERWEATDLVDRDNSSVSLSTSFKDSVSIVVHAQLANDVKLSDDAYLELSTNQASGESGQGLMNPKALTINGKTLALNRWENLFNQTQCMAKGSLTILLKEARKQGGACARFPMDLTLVIPRTNMNYTEASVWLVDKGTRSLVGTCTKESHEASLTVPQLVAWRDFSVYGETGPNALVTVCLNGMRAATTRSNAFGYYTAKVTLPEDVAEFDEFAVSASAQWQRDGVVYTATSVTQTTTYTTSFPVVERITMCYQPDVDTEYRAVLAYDRGAQPNKYTSLYRAEHDNNRQSDEHAKYFWIVEFANGSDMKSATVNVTRSVGSVACTTTDQLSTASGWVPDIKSATTKSMSEVLSSYGWTTGNAGVLARAALAANGTADTTTRAFVSQPVYLTYSPDDIEVNIEPNDLDAAEPIAPLEGSSDLGLYRGWRGEGTDGSAITTEQLAAFLGGMSSFGDAGRLRLVSSSDMAKINAGTITDMSQLQSNDVMAQALLGAPAGSVDEWMILSGTNKAGTEERAIKVHHTVSTETRTTSQIQSEVNGVLSAANKVTDAYEKWCADGVEPADKSVGTYGGATVVGGIGTATTNAQGSLYFIETKDASGNAQFEWMNKFLVEGTSDSYAYSLVRGSKSRLSLTWWNQKHGQRIQMDYTLPQDTVNPKTCRYADVLEQWYEVLFAVFGNVAAGGEALEQGDLVTQAQSSGPAPGTDPAASGLATQAQSLSQESGTTTEPDLVAQSQSPKQKPKEQPNAKDVLTTIGEWLRFFNGDAPEDEDHVIHNTIGNIRKIDPADAAFDNSDFWKSPAASGGTVGGVNRMKEKGKAGQVVIERGGVKVGEKVVGHFVPVAEKIFWVQDHWNWIKKNAADTFGNKKKDYKRFRYLRWRIKNGKATEAEKDEYFKLILKYPDDTFDEWNKQFWIDMEEWKKILAEDPSVVHDPSGIVYEAVLSNPVEGATVQLYTYNPAAAKADLDPATFVDSTQFGIEENPQVTGADGRYQWFVPEGYWQVRASKPGYEPFSTGDKGHAEERPVYESTQAADGTTEWVQAVGADGSPKTQTVWVGDYGVGATKDFDDDGTDDADSYWMPVLPVQLDVNLPLVSLEAPVVATAAASKDGVSVTFSKYMQVGTVTADMFLVGGKACAGISAVDAEAAGDGSVDADGKAIMLARTFRLSYPEGFKLAMGNNVVSLSVGTKARQAQCYAGVATSVRDGEKYDLSVRVDPVDISGATVSSIAATTYTGKAIKPKPTVKLGGVTLVAGTDYALTYANNVKAGTGTVTIAGKGVYAGTIRRTFSIAKAKQAITVAAKKSVAMGKTVSLGAKTNGDGKITYKTSNAKVAKVSAKGVVTPVGVGKATVTVSCAAGANYKAASAKKVAITVTKGKQVITAANKECVLKKTVKLGAKTSGTGKLTYKSSNTKVATVSAKGVVSGKKTGTVKVTITAAANANWNKATKTVTVKVGKANPITAKAKKGTVAVAYAKVKSKAQVTALNVAASKAQGALSYANASTNATVKKFVVNAKTGKVTVPKGTKKGTYAVKVTVTAAGNKSYVRGAKTVSYKIQVK